MVISEKQIMAIALFLILSVSAIYQPQLVNTDMSPTNYEGLVKLGLAPNSNARLSLDNDIFTGLYGEVENVKIGLFQSRTWETGDYGKTFLSPIES